MTYDAQARRDTPLALKLKARIRLEGPIGVGDYIASCLWDETDGYYATKAVIGGVGDFVTAPEISQVFGELLGLWAAAAWLETGSPRRINLVELGAGRGTMMADALRAMARVPGLPGAVAVTIVEASPGLRARQTQALADADCPVSWVDRFEPLTGGLTIVLANEFLDVFSPDQGVKTADGWRRRAVDLDAAGALRFSRAGGSPRCTALDQRWPDAPPGAIAEWIASDELAAGLATMAAGSPLAALFIDYGHTTSAIGETLQAVRAHAYEHPLTSPGEADLTVQVDFADVARAMTSGGFVVDAVMTQAEFLGRLGIVERASRLMAANPSNAGEIEAAVARLMAPNGMGTRFKAIGIRSMGTAPLPGF